MSDNELLSALEPFTQHNHLALTTLDEAHNIMSRLGIYDRANLAKRVKFFNRLHEVVAERPDCPKNCAGTPVVSDIDKFLATPREICLAIVRAFAEKKP